ncbi:MAG: AbrB/MazE/SpoVT family DNA-binding domain-containing protein [Deltaproteobacteria bacterium]|nr:AbrB/MazE/SpoVT family DNA-binding domain-containing protein [Deltaproteobacteria bacterium]
MRKTLTAIGSSFGVIIDKPILEVLGIGKNTILDLSVEADALVIRSQPQRAATSREEFEDWARSLLVRVLQASEESSADDLADELGRFEQALPLFVPTKTARRPARTTAHDLQAWMRKVVEQLTAQRPPTPKPIFTREVARALLDELADARGTFREITAAQPFAQASPDIVAGVLWFLLARGYIELHPESHTVRPVLERMRQQGRVPDSLPDSLADSFKNGVTLLRLTPLGGEYLHELRTSV